MSNTRWISTKINEQAHETLCQLASERGMHTSALAADLIETALAEDGEKQNSSLHARLFSLAHRAGRSEIIEQQLERIAWFAMQKSDEALADELERLCQETGYDTNEIMERAKNYTKAPIVIGYDGTSKDAAARWLQDRFADNPTWRVQEIRELGERAGFAIATLNRAKRDLGIASKKVSNYWTWTTKEEEQQQQQRTTMSL